MHHATPESTEVLTFATLPALRAPLAGGAYAGLITQPGGTTTAVVLLPPRGSKLTWRRAKAWAADQGGQLPTRPVAALLNGLMAALLPPGTHWLDEEFDASDAWSCTFSNGNQSTTPKSWQASAVAVRLIPIKP